MDPLEYADSDGPTGRKPCPTCSSRNTEKVGSYKYECHGCENEWTDDEQRKKDRKQRKKQRKQSFLYY